jgi:prepilin-type processing-associated H-X9-DG protein
VLGGLLNTWYLHVLPPNSPVPDCAFGDGFTDGGLGIVSARSFHPGGVHVAMADGSVRWIGNAIDQIVWQAAGTRNAGELVCFE